MFRSHWVHRAAHGATVREAPATLPAIDSIKLAAALQRVMPALSEKDQEFGKSLVGGIDKYGSLTEKQAYWVQTLIERANEPKREAVEVNMAGVQQLFAAAAQRLKHPKIRLQAADGTPVVLAVAGAKSKYAGQVMLTDGGPFGQNRWWGRIEGERFHASRSATQAVTRLLTSLSGDPTSVIAGYGRLTGACALCGRDLTDQESVDRGVGPVCAKNFGL